VTDQIPTYPVEASVQAAQGRWSLRGGAGLCLRMASLPECTQHPTRWARCAARRWFGGPKLRLAGPSRRLRQAAELIVAA
jgi:hypothetical protein